MRFSLSISILLGLSLILQLVAVKAIPAEADKIVPKVVGGTPINISNATYQVSVRLTSREKVRYGSGHICGGVVVSQRLVITAAHCIYNSATTRYRTAGEFVIVMGSTYLSSSDGNTLQYYVQEVVVHPNFHISTLNNDIAALFINGYIPWQASLVKALALNTASLPAATQCAVTGWGVTVNNGNSASNTLQLGVVPIVSYTDCQKGYGLLPNSQLCAGYMSGGIDACQGDSGGPLICNNLLSGIVSYGYECALANYPGVYANVSYFNDWIVKTNKSLDYTVYKNGGYPLTPIVSGLWLSVLVSWIIVQL